MTKNEKKRVAQDLIMNQLAKIGYGREYEEFLAKTGEEGTEILKAQMDRVARIFGFEKAWFY